MMKLLNSIMLLTFIWACNSDTSTRRSVSKALSTKTSTANGGNYTGANNELPTTGSFTGSSSDIGTKIEIVNFVDPYNGTMSQKLTLPKNFNGYLSIQGINVKSLSNRRVKVRFKFGKSREPIDLDAVVSTAPGLTPQTNVQVLTMNLKARPFNNLRLVYDLYDYNEYDSTFSNISPVQDNRDKNLFCRGLQLDDMSDEAVTASSCTATGDTCRYAYAKVVDKGLVRQAYTYNGATTATTMMTPTTVQTDINGSGYYMDYDSALLSRCLPELPSTAGTTATSAYVFTLNRTNMVRDIYEIPTVSTSSNITLGYTVSSGLFSTSTPTVLSVAGVTHSYTYEGPFRPLQFDPRPGLGYWDLPAHAIFGVNGLFNGSLVGDLTTFNTNVSLLEADSAYSLQPILDAVKTGTGSLLFPRYTKLQLSTNILYFGANSTDIPSASKSVQTMNSPGYTNWMDGCNARVRTTDPVTLEHVGSCNVTAEVQIVVYNETATAEEAWDIYTKNLKLQLVKPAAIGSNGSTLPNVLASGFNNCSKTSQCASGECCYNGRCWSKKYVSKCVDESITSTTQSGYKLVGETCSSDYQCLSLCCNSAGKCQAHDTITGTAIYCSKSVGQQCVSNEWCSKVEQTQYLLVKTGINELGAVQCALRPYTMKKFAYCVNGYCVNPPQPLIPAFDPNSATRCNAAQDPPTIDQSNQ